MRKMRELAATDMYQRSLHCRAIQSNLLRAMLKLLSGLLLLQFRKECGQRVFGIEDMSVGHVKMQHHSCNTKII